MGAKETRIVILGKTGAGKSNLANTIFGENVFKIDHSLNSGTSECQAETRSVNGRKITLIDTPGFFDTDRSEEELKCEIVRCITKCAPGPHAFLIVIKYEKFTKQELEVIQKIIQYFSKEALKYATVVFTHGNQLPEGRKMNDVLLQNELVSDLVEKCGRRCFVFDNNNWNENTKDEYRNNQFQLGELLKSIDKIVEANNGSCYTNEMLQSVEEDIQEVEGVIRQSSGNKSDEVIREQATVTVFDKLLKRLAGTTTSDVLKAFLGVAVSVCVVYTVLKGFSKSVQLGGAIAKTVAVVPARAVELIAAAVASAGGAAAGGAAAGGVAVAFAGGVAVVAGASPAFTVGSSDGRCYRI